ncbi:glutamyl aminopeptidase-like [Ceratina calcarata]|uniref:Glutamyl aminopeptidase-like n=1 Tax=Ceratina calcarata TaxID=156304 RepID=A0AAJ7IYQ7_9HYME|nr:glutamyl aminopeptidase-like [Ceratina calcarata]
MTPGLVPDLSFRLPKEVKPLHYDVYLHPDLEKGTFQGKVTILIDVADKRSYIALHQKDLNITAAALNTYDREENFEFDLLELIQIPKYEMFVVPTKNELHAGLYNLSLEFNGALQPDKIVGFYSSKYKDEQNKTKSRRCFVSQGSSVIRMMENFIGPEPFYGAITTYLKKFMYHNAETSDLFRILQDASPELNVTSIMDTWTRQKGFPVVNVKKTDNKYILTQKRFLADPDANFDPSESEYGYKWIIPITYITNKMSKPTLVWFDNNAKELVIELKESVDWIKFNADEVGYYRVNYEPAEWKTLDNLLRNQHKTLSVANRLHLLEDAFSLASAGELDYGIAMNMTVYLPLEKHALPWSVASSKLTDIDTLLSSTNFSSKFKVIDFLL